MKGVVIDTEYDPSKEVAVCTVSLDRQTEIEYEQAIPNHLKREHNETINDILGFMYLGMTVLYEE